MNRILFSFYILFTTLCAYAQEQYQGLFWQISGNGLEQPSYLYGTMHTQDERAFNFADGVMNAFNSCDTYVMELNMDSVDQMAVMSLLMMQGDASLDNLLSEEDFAFVDKYFTDSVGMSVKMINKIQPMYTASMISFRSLNTQEDEALDLYFFKLAKEQGKSIYGLETTEEQIAAFNSIDYEKQAQDLVEAVKGAMDGTGNDEMQQLMDLYMTGDLDGMLEMTNEQYAVEDSSFTHAFLIERNYRMAERSIPIISQGSTFIAIGAAHLPGSEGVIELLRAMGYTVESLSVSNE